VLEEMTNASALSEKKPPLAGNPQTAPIIFFHIFRTFFSLSTQKPHMDPRFWHTKNESKFTLTHTEKGWLICFINIFYRCISNELNRSFRNDSNPLLLCRNHHKQQTLQVNSAAFYLVCCTNILTYLLIKVRTFKWYIGRV
jgi:hypothetical protein